MKLKQLLNCALFILTIIFVTGCDFRNPGYEKADNKWTYVSYDEGAGKRIISLQVDESTFEIMNDKEYAKDKSKVFFRETKLKVQTVRHLKYLRKDILATNIKFIWIWKPLSVQIQNILN